VTYREAAEILGCHVSNVPKLVRKGFLKSERRRDGALLRADVEALAAQRRADQESRKARPRGYQRVDHRPDHLHEWLSPPQVAKLLGVTRPAVQGRIHRAEELNISMAQCYALLRRGEIRHIKVGGRGDHRIGRDDLEAYIERTYAETERWIEEHPFTGDEGGDA